MLNPPPGVDFSGCPGDPEIVAALAAVYTALIRLYEAEASGEAEDLATKARARDLIRGLGRTQRRVLATVLAREAFMSTVALLAGRGLADAARFHAWLEENDL